MLRLCVAGVKLVLFSSVDVWWWMPSGFLVDFQLIPSGCSGATAPQNDSSVSPSEVDKVHCVRTRGEEVHFTLEVYWRYTTRDLQMYVMCILALHKRYT